MIFSDSTTYSSSVLNPTVLQYVGTSTNTSCLPSTEQAMATFEFSLGGSTAQCSKDFEVSWSGASSSGPYSVTFVPIDGSYVPYEIPLPANVNAARVQVPFAAGTRFTVLVTCVIVGHPDMLVWELTLSSVIASANLETAELGGYIRSLRPAIQAA